MDGIISLWRNGFKSPHPTLYNELLILTLPKFVLSAEAFDSKYELILFNLLVSNVAALKSKI